MGPPPPEPVEFYCTQHTWCSLEFIQSSHDYLEQIFCDEGNPFPLTCCEIINAMHQCLPTKEIFIDLIYEIVNCARRENGTMTDDFDDKHLDLCRYRIAFEQTSNNASGI